MTDHESELTGLDFVADVLLPIKLIVWGDLAIRHLGVPVVHDCYMLGVHDDEMHLAAKKLAGAGFVRQDWSFSSTIDPATRKNDENFQRAHASIRPAYANLDAKSIRFNFFEEARYVQQVVLLPSSYIRLNASQDLSYPFEHTFAASDTLSQPPFYTYDNLYYPNVVMLLQSIIMVVLEERECTKVGDWLAKLEGWAIAYLYGELSLRDDVLDTCKEESVKEYFNKAIKRGSGIPRIREKWGKPKALITNSLIKDFQ